MRAPGFWHEPAGVASTLLAPLGALYAAGTARRLRTGPRVRVDVPVICIGNINAGGTGKTPTAIALAQRLLAKGVKVHAVTRGYGGEVEGPLCVEERTHTAKQVGDEALLLSAFLPTWVSTDRQAGARAAVADGAECLILDDGFQNPALAYDLSIVVVDAWRGFGNGRVIPAGPLREPVEIGLKRADIVLSIGPDAAQQRFATTWGRHIAVPHLTGTLQPLPTGLPLDGLPVLAFAGIGHPEKFFQTLRSLGADLHATHALADHQPLTDTLMIRLLRDASMRGAQVVTTEKDAVRLSPEFRAQVMTVPVRLEVDDWGPLDSAVDKVLGR
ncbi:tetraacyldisaccharide 4'-kinase [Jannaschia sp. CCS1]|uniref:Tetraacyldisaccharide 4'-kinase n=1 Tax=Jannaschia sp. (strain CCS1) TaxID=290400 RepID=LPXK_JANSC|nr:tetraacyldisaccharide 4'-kinase [Jannaschia sp. CCS1]Q28VE6.1 RecName: Full=Tetraacyldisaccharide 4'-kinase; AltName: Full=Lipid A 4'-kinase [Jannaschia sp. CCS1]ABD53316.1 lipid-A-disaccharide kinase [Jannaschia sp. CCS1]